MATYIQDYLYAELPKDLAAFGLPTEEGYYVIHVDSEGNIEVLDIEVTVEEDG